MAARSGDDQASIWRGKLLLAGITEDAPVGDVCDMILALALGDASPDDIRKWRRRLNMQLWRIRPPDRETWGLLPSQVEEARRAQGGQAPTLGESRSRVRD